MIDDGVREIIKKLFSQEKDGIMYTVKKIIKVVEDSNLQPETIDSMELILKNISDLPLLLGLNDKYITLLRDKEFIEMVLEILESLKTFTYLKDLKIYTEVR